jgi:hypothetical protein
LFRNFLQEIPEIIQTIISPPRKKYFFMNDYFAFSKDQKFRLTPTI